MKKIAVFFVNLFNKSTKTISSVVTNYSPTEQTLINVVTDMCQNALMSDLHCDSQMKKYFVTIDNKTIAIDGMTNKVFMLIEFPEDSCKDIAHPFNIKDSIVTDLIDLIVTYKSKHTVSRYEKIVKCENDLLNSFADEVKKSI